MAGSRPRKRQKHGKSPPDVPDISPPRRDRPGQGDPRAFTTIDLSSPRKVRRTKMLWMIYLPDHPSHFSGDGSALESALSPSRKAREKSPTMKQWPKTGLVTGKDIKEEIAKTKKEDLLRLKDVDPLLSGRGAEPLYRDKLTGQWMSKEEKEKPKEIKLEWGKGLAQKREPEAGLQELENEKNKPFALSRDDPELDRMLKERLRWGDPMAHLVKKCKGRQFFQTWGLVRK